jgi:hypothetical protein
MSSTRGTQPVRFALVVALLLGLQLLAGRPMGASAGPQAAPAAPPAAAAQPAPALTLEQKEVFLKNAKIVRTRGAGKGVTNTVRATLSDGTLTHDASIQTIDEYMTEFKSNRGTEFNFRDTWRYNVAAYRLDQMLELNMIPPSIERNYQSKPGAFTWWVDDVIMEEGERLKKKVTAPNSSLWNEQMWHVRLFDQLIHNVDRNLGNLVIDKNWTIWMIDHSRAFRLFETIKTPANLAKVDRRVYEKLKALDQQSLKKVMGDYLTGPEIRALLNRRDHIVSILDKSGQAALFDRTPR